MKHQKVPAGCSLQRAQHHGRLLRGAGQSQLRRRGAGYTHQRGSAVMSNRERNIQIKFRVSARERELIEKKMALLGTCNMAAYLRKMALDGEVIRLEVSELKEIVRLLRYSSNNLNQLTKRAHETGAVYEADIAGLRDRFDAMWGMMNQILIGLAKL